MITIKHLIAASLVLTTASFASHASVVMTGTRVIFQEGSRDKVLQLNNKDDHPNLVQMWVDNGQAVPPKGAATTPFLVTPQIFRMEALSGQVVRVSFPGAPLPKDRESLFYLNFLQIPAMKSSDQSQNKLVLIVNNKLKLFYRPKNLKGDIDKLGEQLSVTFSAKNPRIITVTNPTGYFVNLRNGLLKTDGQQRAFALSAIIEPKSSAELTLPAGATKGSVISLILVNDYGANVTSTFTL